MAWDKTLPLDTALASTIDDEICSMKSDLEDFFTVEHDFPGDPDLPELIHTLPMGDTASCPASDPDYPGRLYINTDTSTLQRDNGETWEDITGASNYAVPAGTKMVFFQAIAPTGWTKDTAFGNDELLRVIGSGDIGSGGSWEPTTAEGGDHTHTAPQYTGAVSHVCSNNWVRMWNVAPNFPLIFSTISTSHDVSHNHPTSGGSAAHSHAIASSWRPVYIDIIVCTKD